MSSTVEQEVAGVAHEWDLAMIRNEPDEIGSYMTEDWIIVGSDGNIVDRAAFLGLIRSGALSHDVMESEDLLVRVHGTTAVVVARGISGGKYQGQPFREVERTSCVFVRQDGQWRCVLTHLSRLATV